MLVAKHQDELVRNGILFLKYTCHPKVCFQVDFPVFKVSLYIRVGISTIHCSESVQTHILFFYCRVMYLYLFIFEIPISFISEHNSVHKHIRAEAKFYKRTK